MSVFATESQYMNTIMTHLADKSDFILSDHETRCKSLQQIQLSLQSLRTVIFPALRLLITGIYKPEIFMKLCWLVI